MGFRIDEPCHEDWQGMERVSDGRYCGRCEQRVIDASRMTESQLAKLFDKAPDGLCAQLRVDADGNGVFRPERRPPRPQRTGGLVLVSALLGCSSEGTGGEVPATQPALVGEVLPEAAPELGTEPEPEQEPAGTEPDIEAPTPPPIDIEESEEEDEGPQEPEEVEVPPAPPPRPPRHLRGRIAPRPPPSFSDGVEGQSSRMGRTRRTLK